MRIQRCRLGILGTLLLAGLRLPGQEPAEPSLPVVQILVAGPNGGVRMARLTGIEGALPRCAPAPGAEALPAGPIVWMALPGRTPLALPPLLADLLPAGTLGGVLEGGDEDGEHVELSGTPLGPLRLPIAHLKALLFTERTAGWTPEELLDRVEPGQEALLIPASQGFDTLPGFLFRVAPKAFQFAVGSSREPAEFPLSRVAAFLRRPGPGTAESAPSRPLDCRLGFLDGTWIPVACLGSTGTGLEVLLPWEQRARVPLQVLSGVDFSGPGHLFLSEAKPLRVEETPLLGPGRPTLFPWKRDRSCLGEPLRSAGRPWSRGIGCHARTRIVYDLGRAWKGFFALVAVDDSARSLPVPGDFTARVYLDGKPIWEKESVRGGEEPAAVGPLDVDGGGELTLEVDFGRSLHLGDRANWLLPVLFR